MNGATTNNIDFCLQTRCESHECIKCPIKARGLEEKFLTILEKKYNFSTTGDKLSPEDLEDIISNFKDAVLNNINKLKKESFFGAWCNSIFLNKKKDHLRKKYRNVALQNKISENENTIKYKRGGKNIFVDVFAVNNLSNNLSTDEMLDRLKFLIKDDPKCVNFIVKVFKWTEAKLNKKQIAEKLGKTYDAFRQYYHRCINKLKELAQGA